MIAVASSELKHLRKQVAVLARALLPRDLNKDILELPPRLSVRALSFRLLCHAEVEAYFEARCRNIATAIRAGWNASQKVTYPTMCIVGFSGIEMRPPPATVKKPGNRQVDWDDQIRVGGRIRRAVDAYLNYVNRKNNGVDEEDLLRLLVPIGFHISLLDEPFIVQINNFVKRRGEAAHGTVLGHVTQGVDPRDEYNRVSSLIADLAPIDAEFDRLTAVVT
ncbi:MAG TPA: hypothetical protein VEZ20_14245 [Allosphingosinicella sp.]|nr:hypothetical protein [Allosphingosinicella sp.]